MSATLEVERKYAVGDTAVLPDLAAIPGVVSARAQPVAHLEAVYVDTADRALLAARIAFRRRTGGHDDGWHAKLPAGAGRTELHEPGDPEDAERVPDGLARALFSRVQGRPLTPIARIRTERRAVVVEDGSGGRIEVVDDRVRATDVAAGVLRTWREWEAEQVGDPAASAALLTRVDAALLAAGARPSASPAKLAQALGGEAAPGVHDIRSAREGLAAAIAPLAAELHAGITALVLHGDPDGSTVHALRRAIRRIRALLGLRAVAGPSGAALRADLRAVGAALGPARDGLVAAGTAASLLDALPPDTPALVEARRRLVDLPLQALPVATDRAIDQLLAPAAAGAYAALDAFLAVGGDGPRADDELTLLSRLARRSLRRAARRARRAGGDLDALHAARRAARRAGTIVADLERAGLLAGRRRLRPLARRAGRLQDALGAHRDLALVQDRLAAESGRWTADGVDAFVLGAADQIARRRLRHLLARARRRSEALARRV